MTDPTPAPRPARTALLVAAALALLGCGAQALAADAQAGRDQPRAPRITSPIDDNDRVTLARNRHPRVADSEDLGRADDALRIERMIVSLMPGADQGADLDAYLAAAHDPRSPDYRRWLGGDDFARRFGVADQDIATITGWLASHGFTVDEIPAGRRSIVFSGTVAQIRSAFRTEMHRLRSRGREHLANVSDPEIPEALSGVVAGVVSLHDFHSRPLHTDARPAPDFTSGTSHALAPADYRTIYNLNPLAAQGVNGTGRSIAVLGRTTVVVSDISTFRSTMNLPASPVQVVLNGASPGRQSGDEGESDLDLEWAGGVAPGATIKFVTSASTASTDGIDLSAQYAVTNNVADIISLSYGLCEADLGAAAVNFYNSLWQQATAQGQTVFVSSGDSGAADCDAGSTTATRGRAVNGLCTSPYATCVGGTQFDDTASPASYWSASTNPLDQSSALSYIPEVVWNESGTVAGGSGLWSSGGGASNVFTKPVWQTGLGVPADGKRDVPDVSLAAASHDGYLVYSSDNATSTRTLYVFGGTSASAPSFAGLAALMNQKAGTRLGNINPRLYQLAAAQTAGGPAYFQRVIGGNNSVPGVAGFAAGGVAGVYNQATGLGSVNAQLLVNGWIDVLPASTTTLSLTSTAAFYGQPLTLTATVSGVAPGGSVQFMDGAALLGSPAALAATSATSATATLSGATPHMGSHAITAVYGGDAANEASTSTAVTLDVTPASTAVNLAGSVATTPFGRSVTYTATVVSPGYAPSGTVRFMDGAVDLGTATLNGCSASFSTSALGVGSHAITALYAGDTNNSASQSIGLSTVITQAFTSIGLTSSSASSTEGDVVTVTATVSGQAPVGVVRFLEGSTQLASVALVAGVATYSTSTLTVGDHLLSADYLGDTNNLASSSAVLIASVTPAAGGGDVPLPGWAAALLGALLLWRRQHRAS